MKGLLSKRKRAKTARLFLNLSPSQRVYFIWIGLSPFSIIYMLMPTAQMKLAGAALLIIPPTIAAIIDGTKVYKWLWNSTLGKPLLLVLYALVINLTYSISGQVLYEITGHNASSLTLPLTFVSILLIPIGLLGALFGLFVIQFVLGQIYLIPRLMFLELKHSAVVKRIFPGHTETYPRISALIRFFSGIFIVSMLMTLGIRLSPHYTNFLYSTTSWYLYHFHSYPTYKCDTEKKVRTLDLGNKNIVFATKIGDKYKFEDSNCPKTQ
ncbi:MAG: hypothetical protein K6L76_02920 [Agarilytica sp.]